MNILQKNSTGPQKGLHEKLDTIIELSEKPDTRNLWMTSKDVSMYIGISLSTLKRYRAGGLIPFYKFRRKLFYLRNEVNKALIDNRVSTLKTKD